MEPIQKITVSLDFGNEEHQVGELIRREKAFILNTIPTL